VKFSTVQLGDINIPVSDCVRSLRVNIASTI
jgi:hypothetical protein